MALPAPVRAILRPREFFADPPYDGRAAVGVVLVVALITTASFAVVGWALADGIDATYTETVQEPWPEGVCEGFAEMDTSHTPEACALDEPRTRQVDVGDRLWSVWVDYLAVVFVGTFLGWLLVATGLHATSALVDGEGSFGRTATVTAWGMLPSLLQSLIGLGTLALAVQGIDFGSDPATVERQIRRSTDTVRGPLTMGATLAATVWQGYVWAGGLEGARDLSREEALFAAVVVAFVTFLFSVT